METLTTRQRKLLTLIIHEYIRAAEPVGSKRLVDNYDLGMSPATVRNEMAALTDLGYLRQPHTSAGRVPTEEGYRYFVGRLMREASLPEDTRRTISHQFFQMRNDINQSLKLAASILANQSQTASLVTAPQAEKVRFKHIQFIATHSTQVLGVLVLDGGEIHQRLLTLDEPLSQEALHGLANRLNDLMIGKNSQAIRTTQESWDDFEKDLLEWIAQEMEQAGQMGAGEIYLDGITNMLAAPEFSDSDEARNAVRLLEERSLLQNLLSRTILANNFGGVQVLIGGEGTWDELRKVSLVLAKYGSPGLATGTLGVLGPMRMPYGQSISLVRFLSGLLSDLITEQW